MYQLISTTFRLYELLIIARVLMSWIPVNRSHPIITWIYRLTEPVLAPVRNLLPTGRIGIDFSPFLVILALQLLQRMLLSLLFSF